jgi:5'-nucleotidase
MNILVVNDDGYTSLGIQILIDVMNLYGTVYVSAPKENKTACGQSITIQKKIEIKEVNYHKHSKYSIVVDGTPADCVRAALSILDVEFDLVVSGINFGRNIAGDTFHSGTVGAALEAKLYGIPSIAISAPNFDSPYLYDELSKVMQKILKKKIYLGDYVLNVNFPSDQKIAPKGTLITKVGELFIDASFVKTEDDSLYRIEAIYNSKQVSNDTDIYAYENGYISISFLSANLTNVAAFEAFKKNGI